MTPVPDHHPVVVIGAGPYGLAAALHLQRVGVDPYVLGEPMSFWRDMPEGMLLRSSRTATNIAEPEGPVSLDAYAADTGDAVGRPVPLDQFVRYGTWVQERVAPSVDHRRVTRLERGAGGFTITLDDGDRLRADRVVVACGIADFAHHPDLAAHLPAELASHTQDHRDLAGFAGRRVLVVGGGQSALESAALLVEHGATPEVVVREGHLHWLHGGKYQRALGRYQGLLYAPTDVGPMGLSRLVAAPELFTRLPHRVQDVLAGRAIRPAGAAWLPPRLADVPITLSAPLRSATAVSGDRVQVELAGGDHRVVDHVLFGTGYRVDVRRYPFLAPDLAAALRTVDGYPVLGAGLETSVPGLHVLGAPAARSVGPTMRFVSGGWHAGRRLAEVVGRTAARAVPTVRAA